MIVVNVTSNTIDVSCNYYASSYDDEIKLPEGYTDADIDEYYVKWGILNITFKDGFKWEYTLDEIEIDSKHPIEVSIT